MIFIKELYKVTEDKYKIGFIHYMPFDETNGLGKTKEELLQTGALVELPQEPQPQEGKIPVMYYNSVNNTAYYEMEDIKPQPKTKEEQLQDQVDQLALTVLQLQSQIGGVN
jgi:hypothetical protein